MTLTKAGTQEVLWKHWQNHNSPANTASGHLVVKHVRKKIIVAGLNNIWYMRCIKKRAYYS